LSIKELDLDYRAWKREQMAAEILVRKLKDKAIKGKK
jgi:hypothetical protein